MSEFAGCNTEQHDPNPRLEWRPVHQRCQGHGDRDGKTEIYVMDADGSGQTNLTNNPAYDGYPAWSP